MLLVKKFLVSIVVLVMGLFFGLAASGAGFEPEKYVVDEGLLFSIDSQGKKTQFEGAEVVEVKGDFGTRYWLAGDPNANGANEGLYKGWTSGIYFFGADGKFISCLEYEDAQMSYVNFSPDGAQFTLDTGTYVDRDYKLYSFDSLELKKSFYGVSTLEWLDPVRMTFTIIDKDKKERAKDYDIPGWLSVVVYDTAAEALETVAAATETEDFMLESVDQEAGDLVITKISVKSQKDWADEKKRKNEQIRVPIPAAG